MVFIVPAALSGAKIAQMEKARMISEEVTRTCQLTLEPLRSASVGPSFSISALVLGGRLSSRSTPTLLRWLPPSFFPVHLWFGTFVLREAWVIRLSHAYTLSFHYSVLSFYYRCQNPTPPSIDEGVVHGHAS